MSNGRDMAVPFGPCEPWATTEDLPEGCPCVDVSTGGEVPDADTLGELLAEATDVLWGLLARPAIGICDVTIHPDATGGVCPYEIRRRGNLPRRGEWEANFLVDAVLLEPPVHDVVEVVIDGSVIDPAEYELHEGQWLVRASGCWPTGGGPAGEQRFVVTYQRGIAVPPTVREATVEIANWLWSQHCSNRGSARFSPAVDGVNTQGMSYRFRRGSPEAQSEVEKATAGGSLPLTALVVSQLNPTGQRLPTMVYSPDLAYKPRTIRTFA